MPTSNHTKSPSLRSANRHTRSAEAAGNLDASAPRRRTFLQIMLSGASILAWPGPIAYAQAKETVLRIAMTLSDIPVTRGQADGGAE